ncbi:MAG: hypothetical protein QGF36_06525 [Candidatus Marinimicrobia bacterium]|nr:hypothetical protein [Candidatus Neomarinimicrobiota bacterium]
MRKFTCLLICLFTACVQDIQAPVFIANIHSTEIDYDQINKTLYLKVVVEPGDEIIDSVVVSIMNSELGMDTSFMLNDEGRSGDLIAGNNTYALQVPIELEFLTYTVKASLNGNVKEIQNFTIEKLSPPAISKIYFWRKLEDGSAEAFDPETEPFKVDSTAYSYLDFQIVIHDDNGLDDLRYVRYQINVEGMAAEDSCNYIPEEGFLSYPQWFLEYKETTSEGFVFDVNNAFLAEPGIPIKPIGSCGRTGISIFKFIAADKTFDPIEETVYIPFSNE